MTLQDFQDLLTLSCRIEMVNTQVVFYISKTISDNRFPFEFTQSLYSDEKYVSFDYRKLIAMLFSVISHRGEYQYSRNKNKYDEFVNITLLDFPF